MRKNLSLKLNWLTKPSSSTDLAVSKVSSRFMGHCSFYNTIMPLNYQDFAIITKAVFESASRAFGTPCDIEITSRSTAPFTTTFYDPGLSERMAEANAPHLLSDIPSLLEFAAQQRSAPPLLTFNSNSKKDSRALEIEKSPLEKIWDDAGFVQVSIKPISESEAPQSAWANIHFKGRQPRHASIYVQPYRDPNYCGQQVCSELLTSLKGYRYHEGDIEHTNNISGDLAAAYFRRF